MAARRVLAIGLDGYEISLAESMMSEGLLPNMRRLRSRSARFLLDHGRDRSSGLAWEHVSTGQAPEASGRWSAVTFDAACYGLRQEPTASVPFLAGLSAGTVVFDLPYCDLSRAPRVRGLTRWGAHDPGVARASRPDGLHDEIAERFGPYPGTEHIYGFVWQSAEKTRAAADALERAVRVRTQAARWLLAERTPDWDLGLVVVSETHSAIEPMWHGVDARHPLHGVPSARVAREGLRRIYSAIDDLVGELGSAFPEASVVLFAMHGMGSNDADVPGMVLLSELLYRHSFGQPYMREPAWKAYTAQGVPLLTEEQDWHEELGAAVPWLWQAGRGPDDSASSVSIAPCNLEWMPAARYRQYWPRMTAFALPTFYDGRVRINLEGREAQGVVPVSRYQAVRDEVVALVQACREPLRGEKVVAEVYQPEKHPYEIGPTQADLYISWRGAALGFAHPTLGRIGPVPYRRTGGHTGSWGFAYLAGEGLAPGDYGTASSFDVVPTLIALLNEGPLPVSGRSLVRSSAVAEGTQPGADAAHPVRRGEVAGWSRGAPGGASGAVRRWRSEAVGALVRWGGNVPGAAASVACQFGRLVAGMSARRRARRELRRLAGVVEESGLFDRGYYLEQNPDIAGAGMDAVEHYLRVGAMEGRDPQRLFDTSYYLVRNPDVAAAGVNALVHYLLHGAAEGRDPHPEFDTSLYLKRNPDVAAAGVNPLAHFLAVGPAEPVPSVAALAGGNRCTGPEAARGHGAAGRVLFVDASTPTVDQDSGSRTAVDLIQVFQQVGYQATFVPEDLASLPRYTAELERQGIKCLSQPRTPSLEAHLRECGRGYDLVVLFRAPVAARALDVVRTYAPRARVVLHTVDLDYLREERQAALRNDDRLRQAAAMNKASELATVRACDGAIVVSEYERELLAVELPQVKVFLLPYVMDVAGCGAGFEERDGILFVGGFRHAPNVDAVFFFVREVLPRVRAMVGGIPFRVIGSHTPAELHALGAEGVEVIGHVPDLAPALNRCRLSAAPLRFGAGIKGKVVLSMAFGVPCVASAVAAEGMGARDGEEILIADGPEALAAAVVRVYTDRILWDRLSAGSMRFVARNYSREVARRRLLDILNGVGLRAPEAPAVGTVPTAA